MPEPTRGGWRHPSLEVRASEIAGRGLFTTTDLAARTVVLRLAESTDRVDALGAEFPNHGCDPCLGWVDELTLSTMGEVRAGSELVVDYATSVTDPAWYLRCHCPSYRCRQMVEGSDWAIVALQARYAGWWAPQVARLVAGGAPEA